MTRFRLPSVFEKTAPPGNHINSFVRRKYLTRSTFASDRYSSTSVQFTFQGSPSMTTSVRKDPLGSDALQASYTWDTGLSRPSLTEGASTECIGCFTSVSCSCRLWKDDPSFGNGDKQHYDAGTVKQNARCRRGPRLDKVCCCGAKLL